MVGLIVLILLSSLVVAQDPPSLTNFQQFYGQVDDLPAGDYALKVIVGEDSYTTLITADGKYGYSPTFKVRGENGQSIKFMVVDSLGIETEVGSATYQNEAVTEMDLQYPRGVPDDEGEDGESQEEEAPPRQVTPDRKPAPDLRKTTAAKTSPGEPGEEDSSSVIYMILGGIILLAAIIFLVFYFRKKDSSPPGGVQYL